jgi:protease-4
MAKPVIGGLLARLGLQQMRFERSRHAGIFSLNRGFLDSERAALESQIQRTYGLFLDRVCTGRERERDWIEPLAEGRVWTGSQAVETGMVDQLGTESDALKVLAEKTGVRLDRLPDVQTFERRPGMLQRLRPSLWAPRLDGVAALQVMEQGGVLARWPVRIR